MRRAIDATRHPALLMVDTISGFACADCRHDEWGVDVSISGSQKGLMVPPGISFNALLPKALARSQTATLPRSYWSWDEIVDANVNGYWPYAPNTARRIDRHAARAGPAAVFARHARGGEGVRAAVRALGPPTQCADERLHSPVLTGVITPRDVDADAVRATHPRAFRPFARHRTRAACSASAIWATATT